MLSASEKVAEAQAILDPPTMGSDLSELIRKLSEWVKSLELGDYGKDGIHVVLHFVMETIVPRIKDWGPTYVDLAMDLIVLPLLKKLDEQFHPAPAQ
jgi:hypothetical protein